MSVDDRQSAYLCAISKEKSLGWLLRGIKSSKVRIVELSRDAFVVTAQKPICDRIKLGNLYRLKYDDELWEVRCESQIELADGSRKIAMRRVNDLTKMEVQPLKLFTGENSISVRQRDPLLPAGVLLAVVITVLITPGWGDELGTSTILTDALSSMISVVQETFGQLAGR